jgi:chorismate lyase/3-hydroxybenzoate synthase
VRNVSSLNYRPAATNKQTRAVYCDYVRLSHLDDQLASSALAEKTLAIISFGDEAHNIPALPCPRIKVNTPQLGDTRLVEVWRSSAPVHCNKRLDIHYAADSSQLFGSIQLPDSGQAAVDNLTRHVYQRIFDLLEAEGYPHLIRVWNYVPNINQANGGLERYQRFCLGRHQAFHERNRFSENDLPAASAIGTRNGELQIYFLAARQAGKQIENPRQVSAFRYPRCYSPRSPSFSRAILKDWGHEQHLYISGTASIVGHESCHDGNPREQLGETLQNIRSLLAHAQHAGRVNYGSLTNLSSMKIYIRHEQHFRQIRHILERHISREIPTLYLQGDICRSDLLLEIEAIRHVHQY